MLCDDEPTFFQQTNMLGNGIAREVELLCDDRFTRVALVCFTVRVTQQADVHRDRTGRQVKVQQLIRYGEAVLCTFPTEVTPKS